jgi:hypothetical protein
VVAVVVRNSVPAKAMGGRSVALGATGNDIRRLQLQEGGRAALLGIVIVGVATAAVAVAVAVAAS